MATRQDIEALHDAYRREYLLKAYLKWDTNQREGYREKLHRAHERVVETQTELDEVVALRVELEQKIGVTT